MYLPSTPLPARRLSLAAFALASTPKQRHSDTAAGRRRRNVAAFVAVAWCAAVVHAGSAAAAAPGPALPTATAPAATATPPPAPSAGSPPDTATATTTLAMTVPSTAGAVPCPVGWEIELCQLKATVDVLRAQHVTDIDIPAFLNETIRLGVATLPYAKFFSTDDWKKHLTELAKNSAGKPGLGIGFDKAREGLRVIDIVPGSPAEKAQLRMGDRIVRIDGHALAGASSEDIGTWVRGDIGSMMVLDVLRGKPERRIRLNATRALIKTVVARARWLDNDLLYTRVSSFPESTVPNYLAAVADVMTDKKRPKGVVLDLRANGGGAINAFVGLVALFTGPGLSVLGSTSTTVHRSSRPWLSTRWPDYELPTYKGKDPLIGVADWWRSVPLVVIVDGQSASAAEAAAAALKDLHRGEVLGMPTYGKGLAQTGAMVGGEAQVTYTSAATLRPNGCPMEGYGLVPDWIVPPRKNADMLGIFLSHREADIARPAYADRQHPDAFSSARKARQNLRDERARKAVDPTRSAGLPQSQFAGPLDWQLRQAIALLRGREVQQMPLDPTLLPTTPTCEAPAPY